MCQKYFPYFEEGSGPPSFPTGLALGMKGSIQGVTKISPKKSLTEGVGVVWIEPAILDGHKIGIPPLVDVFLSRKSPALGGCLSDLRFSSSRVMIASSG